MSESISSNLISSEKRKQKTRQKLFDVIEKVESQGNEYILNMSSLAKKAGVSRMTVVRWLNDPDEQELAFAYKRVSKVREIDDELVNAECSRKQLKQDYFSLKAELKETKCSMREHKQIYEQELFILWKRNRSQEELINRLKKSCEPVKEQISKVINHPQKVIIISPDTILYSNCRNKEVDDDDRKRAFREAEDLFSTELSNGMKHSVVLTIGIPGAGKSTWAKDIITNGLECAGESRIIIIDATNTTVSSRRKWLSIAKKYIGVKFIAACFISSPEVCYARQLERPRKEKVTKDIIKKFHNEISYPVVGSDEPFSHVIVIKT